MVNHRQLKSSQSNDDLDDTILSALLRYSVHSDMIQAEVKTTLRALMPRLDLMLSQGIVPIKDARNANKEHGLNFGSKKRNHEGN